MTVLYSDSDFIHLKRKEKKKQMETFRLNVRLDCQKILQLESVLTYLRKFSELKHLKQCKGKQERGIIDDKVLNFLALKWYFIFFM